MKEYFQIYTREVETGITNWTDYEELREATEIFVKTQREEPRGSRTIEYFLIAIKENENGEYIEEDTLDHFTIKKR